MCSNVNGFTVHKFLTSYFRRSYLNVFGDIDSAGMDDKLIAGKTFFNSCKLGWIRKVSSNLKEFIPCFNLLHLLSKKATNLPPTLVL